MHGVLRVILHNVYEALHDRPSADVGVRVCDVERPVWPIGVVIHVELHAPRHDRASGRGQPHLAPWSHDALDALAYGFGLASCNEPAEPC